MLSSQISFQWNLVKSRYLQHGRCWLPGACLAPGHRQQPWWQIPSCKWLIVVIVYIVCIVFRNRPKFFTRYLLSLRLNLLTFSKTLLNPCRIGFKLVWVWLPGPQILRALISNSVWETNSHRTPQNAAILTWHSPEFYPQHICNYSDRYFCFPYRCSVKYGQYCLHIRYNVVISRVLVIWRHYNDSTCKFPVVW